MLEAKPLPLHSSPPDLLPGPSQTPQTKCPTGLFERDGHIAGAVWKVSKHFLMGSAPGGY